MLQTNADAVVRVLRGQAESSGYSALAALAAARTLDLVIGDTMRTLVGQARSDGATWQDIGDVLGTTRQAAFQRFGAFVSGEGTTVGSTLDHAADRAVSVLTQWSAQDWSLRDDFNATLHDRLPAELLESSWQQIATSVGAFERLGRPVVTTRDGYTVVDVPMHFAGADMKGRVAFDGEGDIAGLFILNRDVA